MTEANRIRQHALALGWQLYRRNGNHEIWISPSKNKMPLPSTSGKGRAAQNAIAQLRRFA